MKLTESGYKYVFRIFPNAEQQSLPLAKVAYEKLKARTAVILHEKTNAGNDNADGFEKPFVAMGGKVLAKIDFSRDVNDFTAIATRIASLGKVDVLPTFALEGQTVRLSQALAQARIVKGGGGTAVQMGSLVPTATTRRPASRPRLCALVQFDPRRRFFSCRLIQRSAPSTARTRSAHINPRLHAYCWWRAVRRGRHTDRPRRFTKRGRRGDHRKISFDAKAELDLRGALVETRGPSGREDA